MIDLATRKRVRLLPLGDEPEAFDLSPDGKTVYVSNEDEGALTMVDFASGKILRTVEVGKEPEGVKAVARRQDGLGDLRGGQPGARGRHGQRPRCARTSRWASARAALP